MSVRKNMKILVSITSFKEEKISYLTTVLNQYDHISRILQCDIDIILSTNYSSKFRLQNNLEHAITDYKDSVRWEYSWENKNKIFTRYINYDYVIESDDDVLISEKNVLQYIQLERIEDDCIPGFLITEYGKDKNRYIQSMIEGKPIGEIFVKNQTSFFVPENIHSAFYMIDKIRMSRFLSINPNAMTPKTIRNYDVACISVSEIYFFFKKIIDLNNWDLHMIDHLPNKYINGQYDKQIFPEDFYFKYRTVDFWKNTIINRL